MSSKPFQKEFFLQSTLKIAEKLIGAQLHFFDHIATIIETEAYLGEGDAASHSAKGPTPRCQMMFEGGGRFYVYISYGMHHCVNIVTEKEGVGSAVLLRGIHLYTPVEKIVKGPGRLTKALGITKQHNGLSLLDEHQSFIKAGQGSPITPLKTPRIGIKKAADLPWRFVHPEYY